MTLLMIQILAAILFAASILSGIWLILRLTSLAAAYEGFADLVPADARPRHSKGMLALAMAILIGGAAGCLLLAFLVAGPPFI